MYIFAQSVCVQDFLAKSWITYSRKKAMFANADEKCYHDNRYVIGNEFGPLAFVYADNEEDAFDAAVDAGKLDSQRMSDEDHQEYESNGWDDSYMCLGNASEPFWSEYLWISNITNRSKI